MIIDKALLINFVSGTVSGFIAVLQKLVKKTIVLKEENELMI